MTTTLASSSESVDTCQKMSKVSGDVSIMELYKEIQLNGRDGIVVNAEASIHPDRDAQIPKRVLDCVCQGKRGPLSTRKEAHLISC